MIHSALIMNLIKLKGTAKLTAQGEWVCLKDSKYILFEILENQTWKGRTSSCRPSQPNRQIGLARLAGACTALPSPRNSNKIYLESLRYTRSPCTVTFVVPFNFIRFLISALCGVYVYVCCSNETFSDLVDELFSNKTFIWFLNRFSLVYKMVL